MRQFLKIFLLTFFTLTSQTAFADGLLYQLPEDGAYVVYDLDVQAMSDGIVIDSYKGTFKMSSVGTVTEKGKKSRWIETKLSMTNNRGQNHVEIYKILIPEENLKAGENGFANHIRGWVQKGRKRKPKVLERMYPGELPAFFCGPLNGEKKLKPIVMETKLGKLECSGVNGYTEYEERGRNVKATFKTRRHKKAPFGVVSSVLTLETERNGQLQASGKMTFTLKEVGKNAKSELPDAK